MCEDYRAAASIDLVHDEADLAKKVQCPLLVLWGAQGAVTRYDVLGLWRGRAANVTGKQMPGGHSFHETNSQETIAALRAFMA
jgi:haloacetate dehalogenase